MQYTVRGTGNKKKYIKILNERQDGYDVEITCVGENYTSSNRDFLTKDLFETCLRTGYIFSSNSSYRKGA